MRILIDIVHPAHIHYFRNFIKIMESKGHNFAVTARNRKYVPELLSHYGADYYLRGKGSDSILGKLLKIPIADLEIYKVARRFRPDIFLGTKTVYLAHISKLFNKPYIAISDTEVSDYEDKLALPFVSSIITPECFNKDFGEKHIRINTYFELNYLHPKYHLPNDKMLSYLGLGKDEKYIILRFVKWGASHDVGQSGISFELKNKLVRELSKSFKVFVSSEGDLPEEFKPYQLNIPYYCMHDALAFATLYIGEGATMASECAMLGTPAIYVNSLTAGTLEEQEKYGLIYEFRNSDGVMAKTVELLKTSNIKQEWQKRRQRMLSDKIDVTAFMVWFVENYPDSVKIMKENPSEIEKRFHGVNPDYQNQQGHILNINF